MSHETTTSNTDLGWDPQDPHGINPHDGDGHHEHFVADWKMQITVLVVLLVFTALTVGFYNLELWIETAFEIVLPKWVNIAGAMSIALIKGLLVAAFFMQLKYDKALNTFVMLFCLFCVALFLGFTMIDLGSRHLVDAEKAPLIQSGGTGYNLNSASADEDFKLQVGPKVNTEGRSLVQFARLNGNDNKHGLLYYREKGKEGEFWTKFYAGHAVHRDELDEHDFFTQLGFGHHAETSNANISRPRHGLTPGLYSDVAPTDGHGAGHDSAHGSDHGANHNDEHNDHATESHSDDGH
jgi:caa(3)-type oxidase subunit IV